MSRKYRHTQLNRGLTVDLERSVIQDQLRDVNSPAVKVIVVSRGVVSVFALAVAMIEPSFVPEAAESVSQSAEETAVHEVLLVTLSSFPSPATAKSSVVGETESAGAAASCITVTMRVTVSAVKVIVALRTEVASFAAAVTTIELSFVPEAAESVSQAAEETAFHDVLLVTVSVFPSPAAANSSVAGETESAGSGGSIHNVYFA